MLSVLLRTRIRMLRNAVRTAPLRQKAVICGLVLFAALLFLLIGASCAALLLIAQGHPANTLSPAAAALVGEAYQYLFFFLLAGSVPFVASTLLQSDDFPLLLTTPVSTYAIVVSKLMDAILINATQFAALGLPAFIGLGLAARLSGVGWLWQGIAIVLLLIVSPALAAALLFAASRILGMRRVRVVIMLVSVGLGLGITLLAVVGASRATRDGTLSLSRLQAVANGDVPADPASLGRVHNHAAPWLPSAWAAQMLIDTAEGQPLGSSGALAMLKLLAMTLVSVALCIGVGGGAMLSDGFLENTATGVIRFRSSSSFWRRRSPGIAALVAKDLKYAARDIILLGQIGTTLILFFVPFILKAVQGGGETDQSQYGALSLAMLVLISYMITSIISLTSVGLEGRGGWLVFASPVGSGIFLCAKWIFAGGLSIFIMSVLTLISWAAFSWPLPLGAGAMLIFIVMGFTQSGLGVGLSGLFPRFVYENPAHRASLWAMIMGFVFSTAYLAASCLIGFAVYIVNARGIMTLPSAAGIGIAAFLTVSLLTGFIPMLLAEKRLQNYVWEF